MDYRNPRATLDAFGNLFLAIELVQTGMTDLPMVAVACHLPFDTIEEIAAAHAQNTEESALCATALRAAQPVS
jgi:hypothetical protein